MRKTKQIITLCLILLITFTTGQSAHAEENWPAAPDIAAPSAIVMEADTGAILYEKDIHAQNYPASITKIMTTLLALEKCSLSDTITLSYDAHKTEGSHVGFKEGEQLTLEQCLYTIMMASDNQVAYAVAEHVGGTVDNFVALMNQKAASLGCQNTHFSNPHGLPDTNHYTSAYDMALIAKAAYANPTFQTIISTKTYTIPTTNMTAQPISFTNHHKMLVNSTYHYDACTGGKTGYTSAARNTLVTYAEKNGMKLICVIMRDEISYSQYTDTTTLLNYAFQNFYKSNISDTALGTPLESKGLFPITRTPFSDNKVSVFLGDNSDIILPNDLKISDITSSVSYDTDDTKKIAEINYTYNQHFLGKVSLNSKTSPTSNGLLASDKNANVSELPETQKSLTINVKNIFIVILLIIAIMGLLSFARYFIYNYHFERKNKLYRKNRSYKKRKKNSNLKF